MIVLGVIVKHGNNDIFFHHHTVIVLGRSADPNTSTTEWHREMITTLPKSMEIVLPDGVDGPFNLVFGIHNTFSGICLYTSA
jgi:hypothetical protein